MWHCTLWVDHHSCFLKKQVVEASNVLFGSPALYTSSSSSFYDHFNIKPGTAAVLALKDHDPSAPAAVYTLPKSLSTQNKQELAEWVWMKSVVLHYFGLFTHTFVQFMRNRIPSAVELDSDNFQDVMNAPHKPLVVLVATTQQDKEQVSKEVTAIARKWRDAKEQASVVFTWMDADKWGKWLKSMYGIKANMLPKAVVADHSVSDIDVWGRNST